MKPFAELRREEIVGREGEEPPILIRWWDGDDLVAVYSRASLDEEPVTWGKYFEEVTA